MFSPCLVQRCPFPVLSSNHPSRYWFRSMSSFAFHARLFILNNRFFFLKFTKSVVFPVPCQHPSDRFNITFLALSNNGASSHFFIPQTFKNYTYLYYSIAYWLFGGFFTAKKESFTQPFVRDLAQRAERKATIFRWLHLLDADRQHLLSHFQWCEWRVNRNSNREFRS